MDRRVCGTRSRARRRALPDRSRLKRLLAAAFAIVVALDACAVTTSERRPAVAPSHGRAGTRFADALFDGSPPKRLLLDTRVLGVSPDGTLRFLVRAGFVDARGRPTALLAGGDVAFDVVAGDATAVWQTRMRFGAPAAVVSFARAGSATLAVRASVGVPLRPVRVRLESRTFHGASVAVSALGPHVVQLGWFPAPAAGTVEIRRRSASGYRSIGLTTASAFRDTSVVPGARYRYVIVRPGFGNFEAVVVVPAELAFARRRPLAGKAMWLSFSPAADDADAYTHLDPAAIVARCRASGIRALELRVAYGPFFEISAAARSRIDALLDAAEGGGIAVFAWTVPRSLTFDDLATAVRAARYRTARGSRFDGLAVDLERGDEYLGTGTIGFAALGAYLGRLREALGPRYPLVATVEDPYLEHLTARDYPYAAIAAVADVLQPMAYWRMMSKRAITPSAVRSALRGSILATRREAERRVPIDVGGQTSGEGPRGAPPAAELAAAIDESRRLGAIGITFFDWNGTNAKQWLAIERNEWRR